MFSARKTILNNLQSSFPDGKLKKELILKAFEQIGMDPGRRGETLTIEEFAKLSNALYEDFFVGEEKTTELDIVFVRKISVFLIIKGLTK